MIKSQNWTVIEWKCSHIAIGRFEFLYKEFSDIMWVKVKVTQLGATLWDSMNYTVHGILQAIILEWVAIPFSRRSSQLRDRSQVSHFAGWFLTSLAMIWCELCFKKPKGRGRGWNYIGSFNVYATKSHWQLSKPNDTSIWQDFILPVLYLWNSLWVLTC